MTLFITLILVFFVVYIFLQDLRSTLIPMIAVPVALIGTFFFLLIFGFSINLLTLSAWTMPSWWARPCTPSLTPATTTL